MGIFEDLYIKMKSGVHKVGEKTNKILSMSKLKIEIAEYKNSVCEKQKLIGKYVCDSYNNEEDFSFDDITDWLEEINNLELKIISCEERLQTIQDKLKCPNCGSQNSSDAKYCNICGKKLKNVVEADLGNEPFKETSNAE